jgi:hypothetical protein
MAHSLTIRILPSALDDLGLDFAHLGSQNFDGQLAVEDLLADIRDALRAERIGGRAASQGSA